MSPQKQIEPGHSKNVVSLASKSLKSHISFNSYTTGGLLLLSSDYQVYWVIPRMAKAQTSWKRYDQIHAGKDNEDVDQYDCMRLINKLGFVVL